MDWSNINRDRDTSGLGPIEYDQTKVPALIRKHADNVRTKTYGQEVREAQARNAEYAGLIAGEADSKATSADLLSKDTQNRFNDQIAGTTNSDEVIDARRPDGAAVFTTLNDRLTVQLKYVNYEMFRTEGLTDTQVIKLAHEYANAHNIPVINTTGEYWLGDPENIPIKTDVFWGKTKFHIDESKSKQWLRHFWVQEDEQAVTLDVLETQGILEDFNQHNRVVDTLKNYPNSYLMYTESGTQVGKRYNTTSFRTKNDFFYVSNYGKLIGDYMWDSYGAGEITVKKLSTDILTVKGGAFILNGSDSEETDSVYLSPVIYSDRSFVRFDDQNVQLEDGASDEVTNPISGFYGFNSSYDVEVNNSNVLPRKYQGISGTYGIHANYILSLKLNGVVSQGDDTSWGVTGTNYIKDFEVRNSEINRVDVHYKGWNVSILNSSVDSVNLTGGGTLRIYDSKIKNKKYMVDFRSDYGSKWDGDIDIRDIELTMVNDTGTYNLLNYSSLNKDFDYGEDLILAKSIKMKNIKVELGLPIKNDSDSNANRAIYAIGMPTWAKDTIGQIEFPSEIDIENIKIKNNRNEQGLRFFDIQDPRFKMRKAGGNIDGQLITNSKIRIKNVDTLDFEVRDDENTHTTHLAIGRISTALQSSYELIPTIDVLDVPYISAKVFGLYARLYIQDATIRHFTGRGNSGTYSIFKFNDTDIKGRTAGNKPVILTTSGDSNAFSGQSYFQNTTFYIPIVGGVKSVDNFGRIGVLSPSADYIQAFTHINSKIAKSDKATVSQAYQNKLWMYSGM